MPSSVPVTVLQRVDRMIPSNWRWEALGLAVLGGQVVFYGSVLKKQLTPIVCLGCPPTPTFLPFRHPWCPEQGVVLELRVVLSCVLL